jgi:hypothetical protein
MHRISPKVRHHPDSERGIVRRRDSRLLMLGAAVEAAAAIALNIGMGSGNGTFLIAVLCFPFLAYALLGWLIRPRWNGWIVLAVIHGVAVAALFWLLSHFQT